MKKLYPVLVFILLAVSFTACNDDDNTSHVTITLTPPATIDGVSVRDGTFTFKNVSTGVEQTFSYNDVIGTSNTAGSPLANFSKGLYNVTFTGTGQYTHTYSWFEDGGKDENNNAISIEHKETKTVETKLQGNALNVEILDSRFNLNINLHVVTGSNNFVIAEIFGAGNYHHGTTSQYNGDQYFRIHNNSPETLYADGLIIVESKFSTTSKNNYTPDIMATAMTVQVVAMIPGSGKDYPVESGKSILICDNALDHTAVNAGSFDLSKANFEWFTNSTSTSNPDTDNPQVPNLNMVYNYTKTIWVLNKQGNRTYAIGRLGNGVTVANYLTDYTYNYTYTMANGNQSKTQTDYKFPNEWIIDAVNLSPKNSFVWGLVDASLDLGFTYFGVNNTIAENVGKGVVRKVNTSDEATGQLFYQDTNNSSVDFIPNAAATLANR